MIHVAFRSHHHLERRDRFIACCAQSRGAKQSVLERKIEGGREGERGEEILLAKSFHSALFRIEMKLESNLHTNGYGNGNKFTIRDC